MPTDLDPFDPNGEEPSRHPALEPPRFGLKSLFLIVTLMAAAIALWQRVGPTAGIASLLVSLVVFAHVAGNLIGSQLRDRSTKHVANLHQRRPNLSRRSVRPEEFAPVTQLSHRAPLGGCMILMTVVGGVAGAIAGGILLWRIHPETATVATVGVGSLATGVLGGFWAFWTISLLQVLSGAWWQAHRHGKRHR